MESELRTHLLCCAAAYAAARSIELGTLGRIVANDWVFFERISDPGKTFTTRTYDRVIGWFSDHWPAETAWPADVPRPAPVTCRPANNAVAA